MTPREFKVVPEPEAYYIPTFGIFMLSAMAAAVVFMVVAMTGRMTMSAEHAIMFSGVFGFLVVVWWSWHLTRVHGERKVVLDDSGIKYFHFSNKTTFIGWDAIDQVTDVDGYDADEESFCLIKGQGRKIRISASEFDRYREFQQCVVRRVPDKVKQGR